MSNQHRITKLKQYLIEQPNDPFLLHALALELNKIGEQQQALDLFEQVISQSSDYVGTYYHLGKQYELVNRPDQALLTYQQGMLVAKKQGDSHSYQELQAAADELMD